MKAKKNLLLVACLLATAFLIGGAAREICGATLIVTRTDDANANCNSNVSCSLREAVAAAASGDTIMFSPQVFNTPRVITLTGSGIRIFDKNLNIVGPGANLLTVRIFDPSQYEVFDIGGTNLSVNISGMKIADGSNGIRIGFSNVSVNLESVDVSNNAGEGIFASGSVVRIFNSSITGNHGGINNNNAATMTIVNSTVSGNLSNHGAGIINFGTLNLVNVTVANNTATGMGGGIWNLGTVNLLNTIIAGNGAGSGADANGVFSSRGNNLIGNTSGNSGWTATDKTNQTANLGSLALNGGATPNHLPNAISPAINAGNSCVLTNTCAISLLQSLANDQRGAGFARQVGGAVDIGAVERSAPSVAGISGRVLTPSGRGVGRALLALTNSAGETRFAVTNPFGFYRFSSVPTGMNYTIAAASKQFTFSPQSVNLADEVTNLNFVANNFERIKDKGERIK